MKILKCQKWKLKHVGHEKLKYRKISNRQYHLLPLGSIQTSEVWCMSRSRCSQWKIPEMKCSWGTTIFISCLNFSTLWCISNIILPIWFLLFIRLPIHMFIFYIGVETGGGGGIGVLIPLFFKVRYF